MQLIRTIGESISGPPVRIFKVHLKVPFRATEGTQGDRLR